MRRFFSLLIFMSALGASSTLLAQQDGYRVAEVSGSCEILEPSAPGWKPLKNGTHLAIGSAIRTGSDPNSVVELVADPHFENSLRIGPDSRVAFLNILPLRVSLDQGSLFILKEEQRYLGRAAELSPEVRILTREFLVSVRQGGLELDATGAAVVLKVFAETVNIQPKIQGEYAGVPFIVEEGFQYSAGGWSRLTYPDYRVWQAWYRKNNEQRDDLVRDTR